MNSLICMKPLIPFPQIIKKEYTEQQLLTPKIDINESISIQNMCVKKENIDICSIEQKENIDICPWSPMNHFSKKNEKSNVCLQLVNIYAQNSILHQSQNIDPKFLSSMLKLMDKYHVNFNIAVQNDEAKKSSPMYIDEDKLQKKDWNQKKSSYKKFSEEEDVLLKNIVNTFGAKNWRLIASMLPNKTARQCRDRYMNYLAPGFIHSEWTNEEDKLLAKKYVEFGPQWTKIQKYFPYRTANSIKNRYNYTVCRKKHLFDSKEQPAEDLNNNSIINNCPKEISNEVNATNVRENVNRDIIDYCFQDYFNNNLEINENDFNLGILDI